MARKIKAISAEWRGRVFVGLTGRWAGDLPGGIVSEKKG